MYGKIPLRRQQISRIPGILLKGISCFPRFSIKRAIPKMLPMLLFSPAHIPTHRVASLPCACLDLVHPTPKGTTSRLRVYHIITNLFLLGDARGFWEDSSYNISLGILRLFMYMALSNTICWYFREALLTSILGLKRTKSIKKTQPTKKKPRKKQEGFPHITMCLKLNYFFQIMYI